MPPVCIAKNRDKKAQKIDIFTHDFLKFYKCTLMINNFRTINQNMT